MIRQPGYDGEYGVIRLFEDGELRHLTSGGQLFEAPVATARRKAAIIPAGKDDVAEPARSQARLVRAGLTTGGGILAELDDAQRAAAETITGPLMIVAGPGSGKTRALTCRIAHLIADHAIAPEHCLAITFTRRAAAEMRERLARLLPERAEAVPIHTFHSLGLALLREHTGAAGLQHDFRVADEAERLALLTDTLGVAPRHAERMLRAISMEKRARRRTGTEAGEAMARYQRELALRNWIDFDDLVALSARALVANAAVAAACRERCRWISVDEFQDVDEQQYHLLTLLVPPNGNICVIGDPDQAIYGFRGADGSCFDRFRQDYPASKVVKLARNYRSTGTIVTASAQLMRAGDGVGEVVREMHERIIIHTAATERAEAEHVVSTIEQIIGGHSHFSIDSGRGRGAHRSDLSFADLAVLYRTGAQSARLCEALDRSGIPYQCNSHRPLADAPGVRALLAELANNDDGAMLSERLYAAARVLEERGEVVSTALQRLTALAHGCRNDPMRLDDAVALTTDAEFFDPRADRVSLLTLHAAKGLEFAVTFIVGLEDGVLPLYWDEPDEATLAEERRLLYVGLTRAKDQLVLSRALQRHWRGRVRALDPSPFLHDIEQELVKHQRLETIRRKPQDRQLSLF